MANLFEKPIAANPMSEFVGLPLDFISKIVDKRQAKYDAAKADIEAQEESWLKMKFLPGDRARHMAIQGEYEARMDKMIEDSGGDYSQIQGQLDRYKRDLTREMTHGELAAQSSAHLAASTMSGKLEDMRLKGDITDTGMAKFNASMQAHRTSPTKSGGWTSFNGYSPSTMKNPLEQLNKIAEGVVARSNSAGLKGRGRKRILGAVDNLMSTDPQINKALEERFSGLQQDPKNPVSFEQWKAGVVEGVVQAKSYQDKMKDKNSNGDWRDTTLPGVGLPPRAKGIMSMTGNSMIHGKKLLGITGESDAFIASTEGKELVAALEEQGEGKMPTDPVKRAAWIERLSSKDRTVDVPVSGKMEEAKGVVLNGKLMNPTNHHVDMAGNPVNASQITTGKNPNDIAVTRGTVPSGEYMGWTVIIGADGATYLEEDRSPDLLLKPEYQKNQIDLVANTLTHKKTITLAGMDKLKGGTYVAKYRKTTPEEKKNGYPDRVTTLYQNGEPMYKYFIHPTTKLPGVYPVKKKR